MNIYDMPIVFLQRTFLKREVMGDYKGERQFPCEVN